MKKNIIIEAGLTGNQYNGHYSFCRNLSQSFGKLFGLKYKFYFLLMNNNEVFKTNKPIKTLKYRFYKYIYKYFLKIDIWHITFQLTDLLPLTKSTKILLTIHDLNFLKEKTSDEAVKDLAILQANIDKATTIVAISNYVKSEIERNCRLNGKIVKVIHNGCSIDNDILRNLNNDRYFVDGDYIFNIGVITKKKNQHILPFLLLNNNLKLVISGFIQDQEYYNYILEKAQEIGVLDRVIITGPVSEEDKYRLYRDCSIFAFPSFAEGFGLPVVEAMRFGKKVLLSKHSSLPEIGGKLAFYLESEEEEYLRNFASDELPILMKSNIDCKIIKEWSKRFNWDDSAKKYEMLYQELLNLN